MAVSEKGVARVGALDTWVRQLAAVVLLAGMVETLLPGGGLRGYARALLSLLVLLVVLQPVAGFAEGRLRLSLPGLAGGGGSVAIPVGTAAAQAAQAAATTYERMVTQGARALASGLPGVLSARVALSFSPAQAGGLPAVRLASVSVTPAGTAIPDQTLAAQVRTALAAGLSLSPEGVAVTVV